MPELPDVELYKRYLDEHALGRTIEGVVVNDARILGDLPVETFVARLKGNRFEDSRRRGKHLLVRLHRDGWLTLHFGMTGSLACFRKEADDPPYDRVRFDFKDGGHLAYVNRRMLGRVGLADDAEKFIEAEELGPDALDPAFDLQAFDRAIAGRRRDVKSVLMDQTLIAGIGNIYADEILFQARLHPQDTGHLARRSATRRAVRADQGGAADGHRVRRGRRAVSRAPAREVSAPAPRQRRQVPALRRRHRDA